MAAAPRCRAPGPGVTGLVGGPEWESWTKEGFGVLALD